MTMHDDLIFGPIRDDLRARIRALEATIETKDLEIARLEDLVRDLTQQLNYAEAEADQ